MSFVDLTEFSVFSVNIKSMRFLKTSWRNLMMANYEVDKNHLLNYLPRGCELDLYKGKALVSVVAFEFNHTCIAGIPIPIYRKFPEINLRFYVKRIVDGKCRRGVVFIKEIIPHKLPAWIARTVFKENFYVLPVKFEMTQSTVKYEWGAGNVLAGVFEGELHDWKKGSEEEFIGNNFWAYKNVGNKKTLEFEVTHRVWKMRELSKLEVSFDFTSLYGDEFAKAIKNQGGKPTSVFYVDGSQVEVTLPRQVLLHDDH